MVFRRPESLPLPSTWRRFTVCNTNLVVRDLTEDLRETAVQLLVKYFTAHEPPCKYIEINKHPTALGELEKLWRKTIDDQLSIVCVKEDDPTDVIGVNVLTVSDQNDKEEEFKTEDKIWAKLFGAVDLVTRAVDVYQTFGVERYLTAYGLVVDPQWRGWGIGKEMLLARIPLCKALDIKVTATVFTAGASQAVARKAGFKELYKISYQELAEQGYRFPGIEEDTKYSKLMALEI
ncbi:uncharacterized protein LOC116776675 isoform X2 [Danaus plexippus]|nr:uncharacterized protein LOC116776675 isoform X2 [Danaus plexippus]